MDEEIRNEVVSSNCDVNVAANYQNTASMVAIEKNHVVENEQIYLLRETI